MDITELSLKSCPHKPSLCMAGFPCPWKVDGQCVVAAGHSKKTLHEFFKEQAWGKVIEEVAGKAVEYTPSSAKAERGDFSELIEYVQAFIAEHNIGESA